MQRSRHAKTVPVAFASGKLESLRLADEPTFDHLRQRHNVGVRLDDDIDFTMLALILSAFRRLIAVAVAVAHSISSWVVEPPVPGLMRGLR